MATPIKSQRNLGATWYISSGIFAFGLLVFLKARSEHFVHGEELAWALGYMVPLLACGLSFPLALFHLFRRSRQPLAWLPVVASFALGAWLIAYIYFDAFRSP